MKVTKVYSILIKNIKIQSKFLWGLLFQIATPIICVLFIYIILFLVNEKIPDNYSPVSLKFLRALEFQVEKSKLPFTLAVPINLPLNNRDYEKIYQEKIHVWSCYQSLKYGVTSPETAYFLENILNFSSQDKIRQKSCQVRFQNDPINAPDVKQIRQISTLRHINEHLFMEVKEMQNYRLNDIEDTRYPTDGFYLFEEASRSRIQAILAANNFGIYYYHHNNLLNMMATAQFVRIPLITETFITQVDLLSNALLRKLRSKMSSSTRAASESATRVGSTAKNRPISGFRQILTTSMSLPGIKFNKIVTRSLVMVPGVFFISLAVAMGLPIVTTFLNRDIESKMYFLMRVNGLSKFEFYVGNLMYWFTFLMTISLLFWISGSLLISDLFFNIRSIGAYFGFMIIWNYLQVMIAFSIMLFEKVRLFCASICGVLVAVLVFFGFTLTCFVYPSLTHMDLWCLLVPHFCYVRLFYLLMIKSVSDLQLTERNELRLCFASIILHCLFWTLLIYFKENKIMSKIFLKMRNYRAKAKHSTTNQLANDTKNEGNARLDDESFESEISEWTHNSVSELECQISSKGDEKAPSDYILCTEKLTKVYSTGKLALSDVFLGIKQGEIYGLLGPNGAGKTTLFSLITRFTAPSAGSFFFSEDESKMSYCPQHSILWPFLTVRDHLEIFSYMRGNFFVDQSEVERVLRLIKLESKASCAVNTLSGGMKRRLSLGISLIGETKLILLDEPTTGMDLKCKREFWQIVSNLKRQKTFILSTHIMEEANFLCDRIGILDRGKLRMQGSVNQIINEFGKRHLFIVRLNGTERFEVGELEKLGEIVSWDQARVEVRLHEGVDIRQISTFTDIHDLDTWELKRPSLEMAFHQIYEQYNC